jgi:glycosyltransferase involved in cell wall biosynthesis
MRICLVLSGFAADRSDPFIPALTSLMSALSARADVFVVTLGHPFRRSVYHIGGITVQCHSDGRWGGIARLIRVSDAIRSIRLEHERAPFSVVHAIGGPEQALLATHAARALGIPSLISPFHEEPATQRQRFGPPAGWLQALEWWFATRRATAITAASSWRSQSLAHGHELRIGTIPLGVDTARFTPGPVRRGHRLLVASSLSPVNDLTTVLRALALLRERVPDVQLEVAGMLFARELKRVRSVIEELGLARIVRFLGPVPGLMMPSVYRRRDLLIHAALEEEEGMSVLEALATGMPVVASTVGISASLPEEVVVHFTPGDPIALASAVVKSLAGTDHAVAAVTLGSRIVRSRFSSEKAAATFLDLYRAMQPPSVGSYVSLPWIVSRRRLVRRRSTARRARALSN